MPEGDYINLGAGTETGFYKEGIFDHWFTAKEYAQKIEMALYLKSDQDNKPDTLIFSHKPVDDQWWPNGFNVHYQDMQADQLKSVTKITFSDSPLDNAIWKALKAQEDGRGKWVFDPDPNVHVATLTW